MNENHSEMRVSVENLVGLRRKLTVAVPAERVDREVDTRLRKVGKRARIKGFRPGKVPPKVIRKHYGGEVRREVLNELMQSSFSEAVQREKLQPAGGPQIQTNSTAAGHDLEYTATFEVYPEVELRKVEGLKIETPQAQIEDSDIDRVLDNIRQQNLTWNTVDRQAGDGDRVTVNFTGTLDGAAFEGGKGEDVPVVLGAGGMLADFEAGLVGLSPGESREFNVAMPDDYHGEEVAGRTVRFAVEATAVEESSLPEVDEEFCANFGIDEGGVEGLRKGIRENMERELAETVFRREREQILEALLEANPVDLPESLVDQEVEHLRQEAASRYQQQGELPREPFVEPARRRVSIGLLIGRLVEQEGFKADREKVAAKLDELAASYPEPEQLMAVYQGNPQLMQQLEMGVLEDQVIRWLIERAKQKTRKTTFAELMQIEAGGES